MEDKNTFILYANYYEILSDLSNEKLGELFRAILEYKSTKKQPVVSVDLLVVFKFIKNQLDLDEKKFNDKCLKNSQNGKKGGAPKGNQNAKKQPKTTQNNPNKPNENENENENYLKEKINKKENTTFKIPSLEEVSSYFFSLGYPDSSSSFYDYFSSNGWKVGKNAMKDWKAAIRNWQRNSKNYARGDTQKQYAQYNPVC